jgi:hypothetical protein
MRKIRANTFLEQKKIGIENIIQHKSRHHNSQFINQHADSLNSLNLYRKEKKLGKKVYAIEIEQKKENIERKLGELVLTHLRIFQVFN